MDVVGKAVEQGAGEALTAEDVGPFVEGQIPGDESRAALVALREDFEKKFCARLGKRDEAELVDDEQHQWALCPAEAARPGSHGRWR